MSTQKRFAQIASAYGMTEQYDLPGFFAFTDPASGKSVAFFTWSNPTVAAKHGGVIPDGYVVILPLADRTTEIARISVRNKAWPARNLPAPTWDETAAVIHDELGPILTAESVEERIAGITELDAHDPLGYGMLLLSKP